MTKFLSNVIQGSSNPQTPGSENKRIKICVLLPAAGRRTQLFHLIFSEPGVCGFADPCKHLCRRSMKDTPTFIAFQISTGSQKTLNKRFLCDRVLSFTPFLLSTPKVARTNFGRAKEWSSGFSKSLYRVGSVLCEPCLHSPFFEMSFIPLIA